MPSAKELVSHVNESNSSDEHKIKVYDMALDKVMDLDMDVLEYTADLAGEIQRDLLRKT